MFWWSPQFESVLAVLRGAPRSDDELAVWIENAYDVQVVETTLDRQHRRERLTVWVRTEHQAKRFMDGPNWDRATQQAIAARVGREVGVISAAVEPMLWRRAVEAVDAQRLAAAAAALDDPGWVWRMSAALGKVFVFLYTDAQVDALRGSAAHERLVDALWQLVSAEDEFGMLTRQEFAPVLDSMQNIDENFAGSTYYYLL